LQETVQLTSEQVSAIQNLHDLLGLLGLISNKLEYIRKEKAVEELNTYRYHVYEELFTLSINQVA